MYKGKRILVVVPARGGSKGVPLKNLHPLLGKPLICHTGDIIQAIDLVDRAVVSTDHDGIAETARTVGIDAPFRRTSELSGDRIGDTDVLKHALIEMERIDGQRYDVVVMLQPTSPLRKPAHVRETIVKLIDGDWDAVWTVSPTDKKYHPLKQLAISDDGAMNLFDERGRQIIARQQLRSTYTRNGASYALTRSCLLDQNTTLGLRTSAVVVDEPMVSIDTLEDFETVAAILMTTAERSGDMS
jgi:CMP-N,N'-diacetyllegionaminic acid synthase